MFPHFEQLVQQFTLTLATAVEGAAGLLVGAAILEALWRVVLLMVVQQSIVEAQKEAVQLRLGRWLAIVLEFLLAADILRTAVAPTWSDIGKLAAIAGIRTALNYFLSREVQVAASQTAASPPVAANARES